MRACFVALDEKRQRGEVSLVEIDESYTPTPDVAAAAAAERGAADGERDLDKQEELRRARATPAAMATRAASVLGAIVYAALRRRRLAQGSLGPFLSARIIRVCRARKNGPKIN